MGELNKKDGVEKSSFTMIPGLNYNCKSLKFPGGDFTDLKGS